MYELVLMMALTNGPTTATLHPEPDTPAVKTYGLHGHREYRHRRHGCSGGGWGGCSGGWGGYGCTSGSMAGYGCTGGYGCMGGYAGGYGCAGGYAGMYGGSAGGYAGNFSYFGASSYAAFPGGAYPVEYQSSYGPMYSMPAQNYFQGTTQQQPATLGRQRSDTSFTEARANPNEATLVVDLPANARLTIDGQATQLTSATRTFLTPALEPGREYYYDLKAELNRNGQTLTSTKRVTIRPGEETRVHLDFAGQGTSTAE